MTRVKQGCGEGESEGRTTEKVMDMGTDKEGTGVKEDTEEDAAVRQGSGLGKGERGREGEGGGGSSYRESGASRGACVRKVTAGSPR